MSIVEINMNGYRSEKKDIMTLKGSMTVENLIPDRIHEKSFEAVEHELYKVYAKYKSQLDKKH